jgi:hypothetical protein
MFQDSLMKYLIFLMILFDWSCYIDKIDEIMILYNNLIDHYFIIYYKLIFRFSKFYSELRFSNSATKKFLIILCMILLNMV